ncbi:DUF2508 family protein [Pelosinus sp. sgz500959]|uniref:DUF2508 family protein n=1 Tax=Pelosinus sp. sgz500959 TaxID=3242472 RepID=UPI0036729783
MDIMPILERIKTRLQIGENFVPKPLPPLPVMVEEARQEWLNAQSYYNMVSDEDLIDHAVYLMRATEKKYMYLLKQARHAGVVYSPYAEKPYEEKDKNEIVNH